MTRLILIGLAMFFCYCPVAGAVSTMTPLTHEDRILVLAPHPDDEAIGAAGIMQQAVHLKLPVKVVYLTNGDSNELSFIVYEKRLVFKKSGVIAMGKLRREEATAAMNALGITADNLIFLGYPDAGTLTIFQQYWGVVARPYKSFLTRVRHVPYQYAYSSGAPYVGESILRDLKKVLLEFKPTRIFVSHPMDNNPDHRALYLFMKVALWDLEKKIPLPGIYPFLVHEANWPPERGYHPELALTPPSMIANSNLQWQKYLLSSHQVEKKRDLIGFYKSQIAYNPSYLYTFARQNELFGDYPSIILKDHPPGNIDWRSIEPNQGIAVSAVDSQSPAGHVFDSLAYARQGRFLFIKLKAQTWNDKWLGVHLNLMGYRRGLPFSHMPKYRLKITFSRFVAVYEKGKRVFVKDMEIKRYAQDIIIKFPLTSLENPHYILSSARAYLKNKDIDRTAWRVLELD